MYIIVLKPLQGKQDSQKLQLAPRLETTEHHKYNIGIIHVYMQLLFSGMHVNCTENSRTDDPHTGALVKTALEICPSFSSVRSLTFLIGRFLLQMRQIKHLSSTPEPSLLYGHSQVGRAVKQHHSELPISQ